MGNLVNNQVNKMMLYICQPSETGDSKKIQAIPTRVKPNTSWSLVLILRPLNFRSLVGAEVIYLGSFENHATYC